MSRVKVEKVKLEEVHSELDPLREDRMVKVWELRLRGVNVRSIAKSLKVSTPTVYNDLKLLGQRYRDEILEVDPLTLVAENIRWLDELERVALFEISRSVGKKQKQIARTKSGEMVEVEVEIHDSSNKSRFYMAALKAREMKLKLLLDTGVIPKEPDALFRRLKQYQEHEDELEHEERSEEEVKESINALLKHGRRMG